MSRVLRSGVDAAEELVKAHHQHTNDQNRINVGIDQDIGQNPHEYNQECAGHKHKRLVSVKNFLIEPAAVFGIIFFNGRHVPCLKKDRGNGGNQVGDLGGNPVDAGGCFAHQASRPGHIPDKETV